MYTVHHTSSKYFILWFYCYVHVYILSVIMCIAIATTAWMYTKDIMIHLKKLPLKCLVHYKLHAMVHPIFINIYTIERDIL